jgi:hypothetical protein
MPKPNGINHYTWPTPGDRARFEREIESVDRALDFDPASDEELGEEELEVDRDSRYASAARAAAPRRPGRVAYINVELSAEASKPRYPEREDDGLIFSETHPDHPDGQVLVVKGRVVRVARTERVRKAIANGLLVETDQPETRVMSRDELLAQVGQTFAEQAAQQAQETPATPATPTARPSLSGEVERYRRRRTG